MVTVKTTTTEYAPYQLRVALAKLGVSGRELARRLAVSPNWVSLRTTGQQVISPEDAVLIAEELGIQLSELMGTAPAPGRRRLAPVLGDVQDLLDDPVSTDAEKQFLLRAIRGLLNLTVEARQPVIAEPQMRRKSKGR